MSITDEKQITKPSTYAACIALALALGCQGDEAVVDDPVAPLIVKVHVQGSPLVGSTNGMYFDAANRLYVAHALGQSITALDPDSGEVLERIGPDQGVFYPDDLTFAPDGSLYWTDFAVGLVGSLTPSGEARVVAQGIAGANPITVSEDGRLFVGQCFNVGATNGVFELDPAGAAEPRAIVSDVPGCASNGMDWLDGALYSPRWYENRVTRVDAETGASMEVTADWPIPAAVKFDSSGRLHAVSHGTGEVVRIDLETGGRAVLATLSPGLDNLAFDADDHLFVSSAADAQIVEVLEDGTTRIVSPGGLSTPMGLRLLGDVLYVGDGFSLRSFDRTTGEALDTVRNVFGVGPFPGLVGTLSAYDGDILVLDPTGAAALFEPSTQAVQALDPFALPADAEPFMGGMAISELGTGAVVLAAGPTLADREVLASGLMAPAGLAADGDDLYVSDAGAGQLLRIVADGVTLATPELVNNTTLIQPEGIAMRGDGQLVVVAGATGELMQINISSGEVSTIASGMRFLPPLPGTPFQFLNDVEIDGDGTLFINGDGLGVVYALST